MGIFSILKSAIKNMRWFNISYHDTTSDVKFLFGYAYFLFCASNKEVAEFTELKKQTDSHEALSIMFHRLNNRQKQQLKNKQEQLNELQHSSLSYSKELYKEEYIRWSKRGLSEEEMNEKRFGGSDKKYTVEEELSEPILHMIKFNENVFYYIHDKINGYYTVDIYAIDILQPVRIMRFTNMQDIKIFTTTMLNNISDAVEIRKQKYASKQAWQKQCEKFYCEYGHVLKDYHKWQKNKQIYMNYNPPAAQEVKKVKTKKNLKQVDFVREAIQGQNSSLFDEEIF